MILLYILYRNILTFLLIFYYVDLILFINISLRLIFPLDFVTDRFY